MVEKKRYPKKTSKEGFLSLFGYGKIKSTAKDTATTTIENQANPETVKHITKEFAEKLIREKVENTINASRTEIKNKLEEIIIKLSNKLDERIEHAINVSSSDIEGKIEESTIKLSDVFDEKVADAINAVRSDIEGKLEESIIKLSDAFDEKVADAINAVRSDIEDKSEESIIKPSNEFDKKVVDAITAARSNTEGKIDDAINVLRSDMESKIEENTIKLSNELDEKIKLNSDEISSNLRNEYREQTVDMLNTAKSTTLAKRIYVIGIGSAFVVVIILLSLISYSKIKSTAKDTVMATIEKQADLDTTKYATKDFAEILISEKVEGTINELRHELDARLEEKTDKLFSKLEENIKLKNSEILSNLQDEYRKRTEAPLHTAKKEESLESLSANSSEGPKETATDKPVQVTPEKTLANLFEYNDVLTKKKTERDYIFEGRHKKGFKESSNTNHPPTITYLSDAIRLNPDNQNAYLKRGDTYYRLKQYKKAIVDYNKIIELDPENVIAYGRRGDAYGRLKLYESAIIDYDKAVDLDPGYAPAYNNRANIFYTIRKYEKAIEDYSKTIELDPENDTVYSNRGLVYSGLKQYEKAIEDYNKAIELAPEDAYNYVYLSRISILTGNYESALAVITRALSLPNKKETEALAIYIECIVKKLLGTDTTLPEREFNEIIKKDFTIWWDFSKLDSWLKNADIGDETKIFIEEKSNLLRKHLDE